MLEVLGELTLVQTTGIENNAVLDEVVRRSPDDPDNKRSASLALNKLLSYDESEYDFEDGCISLI